MKILEIVIYYLKKYVVYMINDLYYHLLIITKSNVICE